MAPARRQSHMAVDPSQIVDTVLVLLDANALLMPFQFSIELEEELTRLLGAYEIAVPSSVVAELESLVWSDRRAKAALDLASRYPVMETEGSGDAAILAVAKRTQAAVLTNDRVLRKQLREAGLPVIYLRGKTKLEAEGITFR